jgi:hypothetical protein
VFAPLRLSFIVPCNLVLDTLMMSGAAFSLLLSPAFCAPVAAKRALTRVLRCPAAAARGPAQTVGAQWLNQTYNALHYRANRNATAAADADEGAAILQAYLGATLSSVGAALGVERFAARAPPGAAWAPVVRRLGPFAAVAAADVLNVGLMRRAEYTRGVTVRAPDGTPVGTSPTAGAFAVSACIAGRVAAAAPILTLPPLLLHAAEARWPRLAARPALATGALMAMVAVAIQISVPLTFGVFKQTASCPSEWLEPHIAAAAPGQRVSYNKGL